MLFDSVERILDKFGLIAYDGDLHVGGKIRDYNRHPRFDVVDDSDRICTGLFADTDRNRLNAVKRCRRARLAAGLFDNSDVLYLYRKTAAGCDDNITELFVIGELAHRPNAECPLAFDQVAARQFLILRTNGCGNFGDGNIVCAEAVRVDADSNLRRP